MTIENNIEILKYHKDRIISAICILIACALSFLYYTHVVYEKYEADKQDEIRRLNIIIAQESRRRDARKIYAESFNHGMILAFDLDGDGVQTVSMDVSNAFFDLDGDGFKEKVGWIQRNDGMLFLDENDNQKVDSIKELFGYQTEDGKQVTGIEELKTHDLNQDNVIDEKDAIFAKLQIWQDFNQEGKSQKKELNYLHDYGITSIQLSNVKKASNDENKKGNSVISTAQYSRDQKQGQQIANVKLRINQANSMFQGKDYKLNLEVIHLPFSRGYGNASAWHIALSKDPELLKMMKDLVNLTGGVNYHNFDSKIEAFIYRWTGVQDVTEKRGIFDGKKLAAMEVIKGTPFIDKLGKDKVSYYNVGLIKSSWEGLIKAVKAKILLQGTFKKIFNKASYDFGTDRIVFNGMRAEEILQNMAAQYALLELDDGSEMVSHIMSLSDIFLHQLSHPVNEAQFKHKLSQKIGFIVE